MEKKQHLQGIGAALTSALFLGLLPILGKQALNDGTSPLGVVTIRTGLAVLLLFAFLIFRKGSFVIYPVGLAGCFLAGLSNGIGSIFYYEALARIGASIGHLLYSFYPLFVAGWLLLDRQPVGKFTLVRLTMAIPGAYLLLNVGQNHIDVTGAAFMLLSAVFYALHLIINQRVLFEVPAPTVTFYTLLSMALTVSAAYLIFDRSVSFQTTTWWPLVAMAVITFLSRLTLFMGVKKLGGMQTALLGLGELIVTVILAVLWLGEQLSLAQWLGAILICVSLFFAGFDRTTPQKRHHTGLLAWLNPPQISQSDLPWQR